MTVIFEVILGVINVHVLAKFGGPTLKLCEHNQVNIEKRHYDSTRKEIQSAIN